MLFRNIIFLQQSRPQVTQDFRIENKVEVWPSSIGIHFDNWPTVKGRERAEIRLR